MATFKAALRPLHRLYGSSLICDFGPLALKAVRSEMVRLGWSRGHVNKQINRIRMMVRWAVSEELIDVSVYERLRSVAGLKRGRCEVRESEPVRPVSIEMIEAIEPFVSAQVWALVQLQRYTGARAGELVIMRAIDLDTSDDRCWVYRPSQHKTAHHGHIREIAINRRAQEVIAEFLTNRLLEAYLFSPAEAEHARLRARHRTRRTPLSCGNRPGTNRVETPEVAPRDHYDVAAYRRAIARGCDQAFPPPDQLARRKVKTHKHLRWETPREWRDRLGIHWNELLAWRNDHRWHPHQIRHTFATEVRSKLGIEAARTALGHRSMAVTEIYAEATLSRAKEIVTRIG